MTPLKIIVHYIVYINKGLASGVHNLWLCKQESSVLMFLFLFEVHLLVLRWLKYLHVALYRYPISNSYILSHSSYIVVFLIIIKRPGHIIKCFFSISLQISFFLFLDTVPDIFQIYLDVQNVSVFKKLNFFCILDAWSQVLSYKSFCAILLQFEFYPFYCLFFKKDIAIKFPLI